MQTVSNTSPKKGFSFGLQPAQAWIAIWGFVFFSALCIMVGAGSILRLVFPVMSFAVAVFLYLKYPILYLGFTWWIWLLTPLAARLVDYRSGWDQQRLMLIAPYLVTLVTLATFLKHLPRAYRQGGLPFILAFISVFYAFLVGLINNPPAAAARSCLDWLTPILFGFHLFVNWQEYPSYRQNMQRTFLWGVLVTGIYGVLQYLFAPEWDRFWIINSGMTSSAGKPEPLGIRVWSTMHSPGPFANFIMAGLLLLFNSQGVLVLPAAGFGYLAFLLSLVRSAWGGWVVGLLTLIPSLKPRLQMRLVITILVMALCVFPLTITEPFSEIINSRFNSLSDVENDTSYQARKQIYQNNLNLALSKGLGNGLGEGAGDSGPIDLLFSLGWLGTTFYLGSIFLLFFNVFQSSEGSFDFFVSAARAISLATFVQMVFTTTTTGLAGMVFWAFLGISLAAHNYYLHQSITRIKRLK